MRQVSVTGNQQRQTKVRQAKTRRRQVTRTKTGLRIVTCCTIDNLAKCKWKQADIYWLTNEGTSGR